MYVYHKYIRNCLFNDKLFKLFALRDRLTLMIMDDTLGVDSTEYKTLLRSINYYISATRDFEIITFLRRFYKYESSKKLQSEMKEIKDKIENHSPKLKQIMFEYYEVMDSIFDRYMLLFIKIAPMVLTFLIVCKISIDYLEKAKITFRKINDFFEEIQENFNHFKPRELSA